MAARPGEASVLLGLLDGPVPPRSATSWSCNKIGGEPDCVPGVPLVGRTACGACGSAQTLVAQLYCPLEGSPYHRALHLLACPRATCSTSARGWRALRSQYLEPARAVPAPAPTPPQVEPLMSTKDWCDGADDWGDDVDGGAGDAPAQAVPLPDSTARVPQLPPHPSPSPNPAMELCPGMDGLSLGGGRAIAAAAAAAAASAAMPRPQESGEPAPRLLAYFLNAVSEEDCAEEEGGEEAELTQHARALLSEYQRREGGADGLVAAQQQPWQGSDSGGGSGGVGGAREEYEPACARHGDRLFLKFMKRTARCPRQVLRYSWGGEPLYVSAPDPHLTAPPTPCPLCGAPRVFEMQLMPALVWQLRGAEGTDSVPEFGSVLVFTCARSCWAEAGGGVPCEEEVRFQPDPDQRLFQ
ncbi:programmed cell death protein 2-like [Petromyzon marinus]|uniref:programmed cell death protein 2-like n=1 Tax=Petromyzon marinus TaxID=7757 RepID=UPI003F701174